MSLVSTLPAVSQMEGESGLMTKKGFGAGRRYRTVSPIHAVGAVPPQTVNETDTFWLLILYGTASRLCTNGRRQRMC